MIREFTQGGKLNADLFGLVGALALNKAVHDELAASISSQDGDVWFVYTDTGGETAGFAQMRLAKNGTAHIRYVYHENSAVRTQLILAAVSKAKKMDAKLVYTNDRKAAMEWPGLEFTRQVNKRQGEFVRWEKSI